MRLKDKSYQRVVSYGEAIVKKPYPKRNPLRGKLRAILINESFFGTTETAIDKIASLVQNGYRRRRKTG